MLKETILTVQTCDLKIDINCNGCVKKIKKILHKIDGVYQTNVNRQQGKATVTGLMDMDTVLKKLKKAGMSAQLWDANSAAVSEHQKLQLGGSDMGDQLKDASGKGEASSSGGCAARISGGTNDATMVLPQLTPTPEQHLPNIQQQIEQRLQTLKGEKLPPHLMGMLPPAINRGGKQSGKKIGGGTKQVLVPRNANNDSKKDVGTKLYQDAGGSHVKNAGIGQPPHNSALGSLNNHSQAKKDTGFGVSSQITGGSMAPQKGGMMRPTNNMIGPASFRPIMGQTGGMSMGPYTQMGGYNVQPSYGGGAVHGLGTPANSLPGHGYYPRGAGSSGSEMMQQVARNPMLQQPYMMVQPQQEHKMMINTHCPQSQNAHYGPGCTGYQPMGYDNGHGHLQQQYLPPMYYPMPLPPQHDNIFSHENPNICSLM